MEQFDIFQRNYGQRAGIRTIGALQRRGTAGTTGNIEDVLEQRGEGITVESVRTGLKTLAGEGYIRDEGSGNCRFELSTTTRRALVRSVHARMGIAGITGLDSAETPGLDPAALAFLKHAHERGTVLLATRALEAHSPDRRRTIAAIREELKRQEASTVGNRALQDRVRALGEGDLLERTGGVHDHHQTTERWKDKYGCGSRT